MTLSHCWGPSQLITTTRDTIKDRIAGIELKDLTKTFRDAVSLTRNLGIRYLWIDSLCIIQLDKGDWEIEVNKMRIVYSQSYLNIAATSSKEGAGGCFKERSTSTPDVQSPLAVGSHEITRPYLGSSVVHVRFLLTPGHSALDRTGSSYFSAFSPLVRIRRQKQLDPKLTEVYRYAELGSTRSVSLHLVLFTFMGRKCSGSVSHLRDVNAAASIAKKRRLSGLTHLEAILETKQSSGSSWYSSTQVWTSAMLRTNLPLWRGLRSNFKPNLDANTWQDYGMIIC